MKVVIFCGGRGTRINEETALKPKPIVEIGGKPILWHIMKIYSHYGFNDFILLLGYKGDKIKDYFLRHKWWHNDFTLDLGSHNAEIHSDASEENWKITFADTGLDTETGGRLLRVKKYLEGEDYFMATYGDGLANVNIPALIDFHKQNGKVATLSAAHPNSKYGRLETHEDMTSISSFQQKPKLADYVNIGFMVLGKNIFKYIDGDKSPIEDAFVGLSKEKQIGMYRHEDFFHAMDTYRDYKALNTMWQNGDHPWKIWQG